MYLEFSRVLVLVGSVSIAVGLYHQAFKVWKTQSVNDFTATIVIAILINELVWLNYGGALVEWPIVVVSIANLPAAIAIVVGYFRFRKRGGDRG